MAIIRVCVECGEKFTHKKSFGKFCKNDCRRDWNNRRAVRGAELYDLVMSMRFDRQKAKEEGDWTLICSLASAYRDADKHARDGRPSFDAAAARSRVPMAFSHQGDKR